MSEVTDLAAPATAVSFTELREFAANYKANPGLLPVTVSAAITVNELQNFIDKAKALYPTEFDAVKIYFVRYPLDSSPGHILKSSDKNLSQVSLIFVPANVTDLPNWIVEDLQDRDDKMTLPVCSPSFRNETGLCPPNCPGNSVGNNNS